MARLEVEPPDGIETNDSFSSWFVARLLVVSRRDNDLGSIISSLFDHQSSFRFNVPFLFFFFGVIDERLYLWITNNRNGIVIFVCIELRVFCCIVLICTMCNVVRLDLVQRQ